MALAQDLPGRRVSILFVCLGNICRSPMAEGVFRQLKAYGTLNQHPLIASIDSCGTGAYHAGDFSDPRTISVLEKHGITNYQHKACKIKVPEDLHRFDYVIGMDLENVLDLRSAAKSQGLSGGREMEKISLYGRFDEKAGDEEVDDPYYGERDGFEVAYEQVTRFGKGLLKHLELQAAKELGSEVP
ncbi:hypothetical protein BAUCODRAFT_38138 [Baudoinia panamericana UAMH 10762]|uniref:Phosphotyrosine protein phosphatase I domain-containing protein n=1 Tax=Baudoinia panamericana (strain UAMH 10762) TaxID=717646 RepID=M2N0H8_BAUPA|nr:uncharacterized protein BAUCODRAFT_38138 [Baudoinia panamericana UAMH 10762]EMC92110.1 hypothetical protein BAUCODRAFT_38138 [Baudoinia panamericana UAMH 10762]